jgi:hypothetical protein
MRRSFIARIIAGLVLASSPFILAGCGAGPAPSSETGSSESMLSVEAKAGEAPGAMHFDASRGRGLLASPAQMRKFADWEELAAFAQKELNGEIARNESGTIVSIRGTTTAAGQLYWDAGDGKPLRVDSPVAVFLGGKFGKVMVGDQEVAVRDDRPRTFTTRLQCSTSGGFCIEGNTWITHLIVYHEAGGKVVQKTGGYHSNCTLWWCSPTGHNALFASGSFEYPDYVGNGLAIGPVPANSGQDVESVTATAWEIATVPVSDPIGDGRGMVSKAQGVCMRFNGGGDGANGQFVGESVSQTYFHMCL